MQNIAHRGASVDALENTLEAFALAVEQGADMIETDLHLLRDGVVALYHDDEIGGVPVGELTLAELRGHLPRAPTLQEALDRFGARIPWNLEIKSPKSGDYAGLERIALDEVRRRGILEQTLFSSFSDSVLARLRELGALSLRRLDGVVETAHFPLPKGLGDKSMAEVAASRTSA